jgi:CubicO group peptidase (beta-lactamase class C family)
MFPMRYSAGMVLGGNPIGIYGPFTQHAYGHLGFMNNFCCADPERDIAVSLLTTGKAILGWHLIALTLTGSYLVELSQTWEEAITSLPW